MTLWNDVVAERLTELDSDIKKIKLFLGSTEAINLPATSRRLLWRQKCAMEYLQSIMSERVASFSDE